MKSILGLDLGPNSIGGSLIEIPKESDRYGTDGKIVWMGSRIIPTDPEMTQRFQTGQKIGVDDKGTAISPAAKRRQKRMSRRLKHRYKLRRTRLIKVFKALGWVESSFPEDFKCELKEDPEFKFNINDYLPFEETTKEEATKLLGVENNKGETKVPEDWIVYYLRKKALQEKISFAELARILYMMNQRRGYEPMRGDQSEEGIKRDQVVAILRVDSVTLTEEARPTDKKGLNTYLIEAGEYKWEVKKKEKPDWEGKEFKYLITLDYKSNGLLKSIPRTPGEEDWELSLVALDNELESSGKTVGAYFFDKLVYSKEKKNYRIRQQVVQREKYKRELETIWEKQLEFSEELKQLNNDKELLREIAAVLYPTQVKINESKLHEILARGLLYVFSEDIIYYQRPLKSQTQHVAECRYEKKKYVNTQTGEEVTEGYKVAPRSSPEAQEFRIWQDIHNLRIIEIEHWKEDKLYADVDVTENYINDDAKSALFEMFDSSKEIAEKDILKVLDLKTGGFKVNLFVNRTLLKGNETKYLFRKTFRKHGFDGEHLLSNSQTFYQLWHLLYSIKGTNAKKGITKGLFNPKYDFKLPTEVIEDLAGQPDLPRQFAKLSSKAIHKMLPLMRCGKYWNEKAVQEIVSDFLKWKESNEFHELGEKIKSQLEPIEALEDFRGIPPYKAGYIVYGRHSERESSDEYRSYSDIDVMQLVPYNSMRNPIVEKVIRETMYLVKDVWEKYGQPDEIHIELGRDLKATADERQRMSDNNAKNFAEKQRIKKLLIELKKETRELNEANPNSPLHIDKFKIWKANGGRPAQEEFDKLFNKKNDVIVTSSEIKKYKLWADQNHISPYTGRPIPISRLFTRDYDIEHIIPQSKLKYDSYDNLVIVESAVNDFKGNRLARTLINDHGGQTIIHKNVTFTLLDKNEYEANCNHNFFGRKRKNLLREDIPDDFISRQLNEMRFISRKISELLYPVAKSKEGIVLTTGSITSELKNNWGLTDVWKELMKPRYERLERILDLKLIQPDNEDPNKYHINPPLDDNVKIETDTKRIDHRHHALDALIVAATTRAHIKYLNSLHSHKKREEWKYLIGKRYRNGDETKKARDFKTPWPDFTSDAKRSLKSIIVSHKVDKRVVTKPKNKYLKWVEKNGKWMKDYQWQDDPDNKWWAVRKSMFKEPLGSIFLKEVKSVNTAEALKIQLERNKGSKDRNGRPRDYIYGQYAREQLKLLLEKTGSDLKEATKALKHLKGNDGKTHKKIRVAKYDEYAAVRVNILKAENATKLTKDYIEKSIPYAKRAIQSCDERIKWDKEWASRPEKWPLPFLLVKHLENYDSPREAFTGEGYEALTKRNGGQAIKFITRFEKVGKKLNFNGKLVETDQGGNVFFVIRENSETGQRDDMYSVPLWSPEGETDREKIGAINRLINGEDIADTIEGYRNIVISPNELVYVPTQDEISNPELIEEIDWCGKDKKKVSDRIYKMVSCTEKKCLFVPANISKGIMDKEELGAGNKSERAWDGTVEYVTNSKGKYTREDSGTMIKNICIPLTADRLGNIEIKRTTE